MDDVEARIIAQLEPSLTASNASGKRTMLDGLAQLKRVAPG
jgi:hypothetical protein